MSAPDIKQILGSCSNPEKLRRMAAELRQVGMEHIPLLIEQIAELREQLLALSYVRSRRELQ